MVTRLRLLMCDQPLRPKTYCYISVVLICLTICGQSENLLDNYRR